MSTIKPTDDFFEFVNGKWIAENPIPPQESRWGSFMILRLEVEKQLKVIFEEVAAAPDASLDANARKVRDFYRTGLDEEKLNAQRDEPLAELIEMVDGVGDAEGLARAVGFLHRRGINAFWGFSVEQDMKNSEMMAAYVSQAGLSLPDRDYYLNDDAQNASVREKYIKYTHDALRLSTALSVGGAAGVPVPAEFIEIEKHLAAASMTRVELRDPEKQYNKMTIDQMQALAPAIRWDIYFAEIGIAAPDYVIVTQPEFIKAVGKFFEAKSFSAIKGYLKWHVLNGTANFLSEDFARNSFEFYGRTFSGASEIKPRWRRVLGVVNAMLDDSVAQLYVKRHFSEDAKEKINKLVDNLTEAFRVRIENLDWMGPETKQRALAKLGTFTRKLGYPDVWRDMSNLEIGTDSYVQNYFRAHTFEFDRRMKKIGKPVDRSEWGMSPQTVNACYEPLLNEVLFPAAFLQPPFFDPSADDATNYGAVGSVIGHELTHGFDDQGSQFDLHGNLKNWWTKEDRERFEKLTARLVEQFDAYEPLPGLHVNGKLTLGENIADLGGVVVAYAALVAARDGDEDPEEMKKFFTGFAIFEQEHSRDEFTRLIVQTDPHSPSRFRVNGTVSNSEEFYRTYGCKPGDKLYREPEDRVKIW